MSRAITFDIPERLVPDSAVITVALVAVAWIGPDGEYEYAAFHEPGNHHDDVALLMRRLGERGRTYA